MEKVSRSVNELQFQQNLQVLFVIVGDSMILQIGGTLFVGLNGSIAIQLEYIVGDVINGDIKQYSVIIENSSKIWIELLSKVYNLNVVLFSSWWWICQFQ